MADQYLEPVQTRYPLDTFISGVPFTVCRYRQVYQHIMLEVVSPHGMFFSMWVEIADGGPYVTTDYTPLGKEAALELTKQWVNHWEKKRGY